MIINLAVRAFVARMSVPFIDRVVRMGRDAARTLAEILGMKRAEARPAGVGVATPRVVTARSATAPSRGGTRSGVWRAPSPPSTARSGETVPARFRSPAAENQQGGGDRPSASVRPMGDAYKAAPPALRYVGVSSLSIVPLNTRSARRIAMRFNGKVCLSAEGGVYAAHCNGPRCDKGDLICACPCLSCDWRRVLYDQATDEVVGPRVVAEHTPTVADRIVRRWHALQLACEAEGKPALHCEGNACGEGEEHTLCECECEGCERALGLLVDAERDVVAGFTSEGGTG
jgi:hypothetical protein